MSTAARPLVRRLAVTVSFLLAMVGTAIGVGAFGGDPIAEAAGGLLAADSTHLAPASPAFTIWSVIYAGLGAYTLWQWWDRHDERGIAPGAILSLLLNAAWILTIQAGLVGLSVVVIALLVAVLGDLFRRLSSAPPGSPTERIVVDGTFGLYLGWASVATCANIAAALKGAGFTGFGVPSLAAVAVLAVVAVLGVALVRVGRAPIAAPLAMMWGLSWIAVGRATDAPHAPAVAIAAVVAALVIGAAATVTALRPRRHRRPRGPRRPHGSRGPRHDATAAARRSGR